MSATWALFERWKTAKGHASNNAAALALGSTRQTVQCWKDGRNGGAEVIERMCADLGEDPVPVILQAFAEAARDTEDRKALQRLARRFKAALAGLMLASVAGHYPAQSQAASGHEHSQGVFIMRTLGRLTPPAPAASDTASNRIPTGDTRAPYGCTAGRTPCCGRSPACAPARAQRSFAGTPAPRL